ncbi:MAG TPA: HAMP domain-containing sensor histidine kinase [Gemmatimonadales bacterium]|nr:HAMP domain-containing sensor histidine kinase [Gemmatimonadales bacterium]
MNGTGEETIVPNVLLVDDRPENLVALEATLKPLGVRLVKAASGEEALSHLLRETFAVILLDIRMPRLDGLQTAELIRSRELTRHIPIIFMTAFARETASMFQAYARGAVDYLLKPLEPEILRAKVRVFCDLFVRGELIRRRAVQGQPKDVFFASVVHELQTPLAAAKAQVQLALHQLEPRSGESSTSHALQVIAHQIDSLARLVGDLLDANHLDLGVFEVHPFWFDLPGLLDEVRTSLQALSDKHPIHVRSPEHLAVLADRGRIGQVLSNLLSNAIRYSPDGGDIDVLAEQERESVHVAVQDHGLGVPNEHQNIIFERFSRAHRASGGLGLGLMIAKGIVQRHGGRIWVESDGVPSHGSTFHVTLPLPATRG